ncbi:thioesterase domain-containing protein [Bacillus velezensis]|uniref:thioesterase domain-containing protein n=1 Tax=Bacillus velezensis TaxID=492670 RepID=UPI0009ABFB30|nr:hypothetical protein B9C53_08980 [Bacillus velezensis]
MRTEACISFIFSRAGADKLQLLNKKQDRNLFAFPPVGGIGIVYSDLAKLIQTHSFYALDFIEENKRIEQYVELILNTQAEGPYLLLGYSRKKIMINSFYIIGKTLLREQCIIIMDSGNMVKCFQRIIYQEIRH